MYASHNKFFFYFKAILHDFEKTLQNFLSLFCFIFVMEMHFKWYSRIFKDEYPHTYIHKTSIYDAPFPGGSKRLQ